jgi:hypothetical protein
MLKFNKFFKLIKPLNMNTLFNKYNFKNFYYTDGAERHGAGEVMA